MSTTYFNSDGCTGVPDLWLYECCEWHDFLTWSAGKEAGDWEFLACILVSTIIVAAIFSFLFWFGMLILRPVYRKYQSYRKDSDRG